MELTVGKLVDSDEAMSSWRNHNDGSSDISIDKGFRGVEYTSRIRFNTYTNHNIIMYVLPTKHSNFRSVITSEIELRSPLTCKHVDLDVVTLVHPLISDID